MGSLGNDDLEILCEENDFYLVMYPFLSTGKFVSAYIKKDVANVSGSIPNANECYNINKKAICITSSSLYHNASDESLLSSTGVDKKSELHYRLIQKLMYCLKKMDSIL